MSNFRQIFFIFVRTKDITEIQVKDLESFQNELKKVTKIDTSSIDKKLADLYSISFKTLTGHRSFFLLFFDKSNSKTYTSEKITFKNDADNFIYDIKIFEDTGAFKKIITFGIYNTKEHEYFKLNKS